MAGDVKAKAKSQKASKTTRKAAAKPREGPAKDAAEEATSPALDDEPETMIAEPDDSVVTTEESLGSTNVAASTASETQPTEHDDDKSVHSRKVSTSSAAKETASVTAQPEEEQPQPTVELSEKSDSVQPTQPEQPIPPPKDTDLTPLSPTSSDVVNDPPTLRPLTTGLDLSQSQLSPARSEDAPSIVTSPAQEKSESELETDRPAVPGRTISEGLSKKMTGTFSWLSRATNMRKVSGSPSAQPNSTPPSLSTRRATNSSVSTIASNQLPILRDGQEFYAPRKESLQDRFIALRMEEENHEVLSEAATTPSGEQPSKTPAAETAPEKPAVTSPIAHPGIVRSPTIVDSKLPPGSAAGLAMGPSPEDDGHVNWDLWQQLVYEGPSAVNKTSGEELNAAIQSGIPAPIRGVVWQVLADSKSDTLELVYRDLLGKEDTALLKSPSLARANSSSNVSITNGIKEEASTSSASSIKSGHSSAQETATTVTSPPLSNTNDQPQNDDEKDVPPPVPPKRTGDHKAQIQKLEKQIRKDLGARTAYSKHIASAGLQEGLFGVCKAYALYDEDIGYAQGMNFIAMPLLFNMPEEEAFTLFVKLMSKYDLRSLFTPEMTGLHMRLYQFERLLEDFEPALYCHLHRRGVSPILYATPWFLTLFAYRFPLQLVQRIYDLLLTEGLSAITKFGIVLMRKNASTLLGMQDMGQLTNFLKDKLFDVYIDKSPSASSILDSGFFGLAGGVDKEVYHADALVRDACAIDISSKTLSQYAAEYEEKAAGERERESELENLRTTNAKLSAQLRSVEARVQQQDTDHVGLASELIKTKVENQSLSDDNESLRTQVEELRNLLEHQPAEVEARLKSEMDRIMARNMEVQNSNRALEDQMQEMEQELVGTKLQHAQLNAEYEDIKQKLSSIQQMLGGGGASVSSSAAVSPAGNSK